MLNEPVSVAGMPLNIYCMLRDLFIVREAVRSILKSRKGSRVALICNDSFLLVAAGVVTLSLESSLGNIAFTNHSECEIKPRLQTAGRALSGHVANIGQETRKRHAVSVFVRNTDVSDRHGKACRCLESLVPELILGIAARADGYLYFCSVARSDENMIVVYNFISHGITCAVLTESTNAKIFGTSVVSHVNSGIGKQLYFGSKEFLFFIVAFVVFLLCGI